MFLDLNPKKVKESKSLFFLWFTFKLQMKYSYQLVLCQGLLFLDLNPKKVKESKSLFFLWFTFKLQMKYSYQLVLCQGLLFILIKLQILLGHFCFC